MVSVSDIYDSVLALIRKDKRGLSFSPDDFNKIIPSVNQRIYKLNWVDKESNKESIEDVAPFKVVNYSIALDGTGKGILPANFQHLVGDPWYTHATAGRRKIELVTSLEFGDREMDYLSKSTALYPMCYMGYGATSDDTSLFVSPVTATPIYIDYLRKVATPYLDYYVNDTTLEVTYLTASQALAMGAGYTYRDGTAGPANIASITVNFDWSEDDIPQIENLILEAVGVSFPDEVLIQDSAKNLPIIEAT